jgi:uroporphyrinogen-III synthase
MGHEPLLLPLTRPVHRTDAVADALEQSRGAIAVTSAEAIRAIAAGRSIPAYHRSRLLFAVGRATAEEAAAAGFTNIRYSEGGGGELAADIARHLPLLGSQPLLYLAGSPRAQGLESGLADRAIQFETVEAYEMHDEVPTEAALHHIFRPRRPDAVLFYSRHTAERFFALPFIAEKTTLLSGLRLYCLSAQVASAIPASFDAVVEIAADPDENALLDLLGDG